MKRKILISCAVGACVVAAFFLYYTVSPLFRVVSVNETLPQTGEARIISEKRPIIDTPTHPASGFVSLIETENQLFVRYEQFKTINGPDLFVYLSTDIKATDYVSLGELRATEGNINYKVPAGTDMQKYRYVLVWCKQFGVLFNSADLESSGIVK